MRIAPTRRWYTVISAACGLAVALVLFGSYPLPSSASPQAQISNVVQVQANLGWQNSGINLNAGDRVRIEYVSGLWTSWVGGIAPFDGAGPPSPYVCANFLPASQCVEPIPDFPSGALIGRVGSQLLRIGNALDFTVQASGSLALRMNDGDTGLSDNQGAISVRVTRTPVVQVQANQGWQNSGISLNAGDRVRIEYVSGLWTSWAGGIAPFDGAGPPSPYVCANFIPANQCVEPIPDFPSGALVGRVGTQLLRIGNALDFTVQAGGSLALRMNDGDAGLSDNQGAISVRVTINSQLPAANRTVFALAYIDAIPVYDPDQIHAQLISDLASASIWHGYQNPGGQSQVIFRTYGGSLLKLNEAPPHRADNGKFDYAAVYSRFDLCNKARAGQIDEVWVWESGTSNSWEWVTNGPTWFWINDSNVPNCGRTITSLNFNYQREVDLALHSYGHRLEGLFMTMFPCQFYTRTWPWTGWPSQCQDTVSDRYGYVARPFAGNGSVGVCGDVHHPPNILDAREYVYNDPATVQSICKNWQQDGSATPSAVSCRDWGCTQRGFMMWWMQNLPGAGNNLRDRNGNPMPNWWSYLFDPPATPSPTPTRTPLPTAAVPTATRTPSPTIALSTATRTPTSTPAPSCAPRPDVRVATTSVGDGQLQVTISSSVAPGTPSNSLRSIRFVGSDSHILETNALVDLGGQVGRSGGFTVTLLPGTTQTSFVVRRATPGQATTLPLIVTDACGDWQTLIGGGPSAW